MIEPVIFKFQISGDPTQLPFWPLTYECKEFVYVVQTHSLLEGANVVVWLAHQNREVEKRIYATGCINPHRPLGNIPLNIMADDSISRSDRIERAVDAALAARPEEPFSERLRLIVTTWEPLINQKKSVSREQFDSAFELAQKIKEGNGNLLGVDTGERIIAARAGERIDWCTWEGNADPEDLWNNVDEILRLGEVLNLKARQLK